MPNERQKKPKLKKPLTQEDMDNSFEIWRGCAEELGLLDVYKVVSYYYPDGKEEVMAITFAVNLESLIAHAKNILEEAKLQQSRFAKVNTGN